jgi:NADPH:quinone reductase-like Zn-dependent oxidoreductase
MQATRRRLVWLAGAALAGASTASRGLAGETAAMKPLRILILGGTGFIGPHQVDYALARGHQVTVFNRGRQGNPWSGKVEELIGDRNTGDLAALAGREWEVCIDNPGGDAAGVRGGHRQPLRAPEGGQ